MLTSFFSLFLTYNLLTIKKKNISFFQEDFYLFIYFSFLVVLFFLITNLTHEFASIFLAICSSISNIGISLKGSYQNLSFIFLLITIVGGSFFSTSSGIRFVKLYLLFKFSFNELLSHAKPLNIYINKLEFSKSTFDSNDINKYFISVLVFILSLFILSSLLTISGINLENSFKLSILTIMNTVNSNIHGLNEFNFEELHYLTKYFLIFFMIIGRVELLTLLIIIKKFLFKN
tara:strand:+ start:187 stop:882 length:696 start_codon:yes stop_codon:yes gene_type:complete